MDDFPSSNIFFFQVQIFFECENYGVLILRAALVFPTGIFFYHLSWDCLSSCHLVPLSGLTSICPSSWSFSVCWPTHSSSICFPNPCISLDLLPKCPLSVNVLFQRPSACCFPGYSPTITDCPCSLSPWNHWTYLLHKFKPLYGSTPFVNSNLISEWEARTHSSCFHCYWSLPLQCRTQYFNLNW